MDDVVKLHNKGSLIIVYIIPNSKKIEITGLDPWRKALKVKVTEPAKQNRANRQIKKLFSNLFDAEATIISGEKSNIKKIYVPLGPEKTKEKLKKSIKNP